MKNIIDSLPDQIHEAIDIYKNISIKKQTFSRVVLCGMGGSGISGTIARALYPNIDIFPNNDYEIHHRVDDHTLAILISYSGNTEETLTNYRFLARKKVARAIISSNGQLLSKNALVKIPVPAGLPPRGALGYLFTPIPMILYRCGLLKKNPVRDYTALARYLRGKRDKITRKARNIAAKISGKLPIIYTDSHRFQPVAQRWQCQFNENAKVLAHVNVIPEMNHNEIVGIGHPKTVRHQSTVILLHDPQALQRNVLRMRFLPNVVKKDMPPMIKIQAQGSKSLYHMFWTIWLGDYVSYYYAKRTSVDPLPVKRIEHLKKILADH